jgi:hypothetical protein
MMQARIPRNPKLDPFVAPAMHRPSLLERADHILRKGTPPVRRGVRAMLDGKPCATMIPIPPSLNPRLVIPMEKSIPKKREGETTFQQHIRGEIGAMKDNPSKYPGGRPQAIAIAAHEAGVAKKAGYSCSAHKATAPEKCPAACDMRKTWEQSALGTAKRAVGVVTQIGMTKSATAVVLGAIKKAAK